MSDSSPGQIIGGIIGATVGFVVGGPQGAIIGFNAGYTAGGIVDPPELPGVEGPRLNDLKIQGSQYGKDIPIVYGRARLAGNLLWVKDNQLIEKRVVTEEGGKGGGGSQEVVTYEYYATFAVGVCEGPVTGIRRIWADSVLIYDAGQVSSVVEFLAQKRGKDGVTIYLGTSTQEPDTLIEADVTTAPAYRGLCYVVFDQLALKKYGNRIPNMTFEVAEASEAVQLIQTNAYTQEYVTDAVVLNSGYQIRTDNYRIIDFLPEEPTGVGADDDVWITKVLPDGRQTIGGKFTIQSNHAVQEASSVAGRSWESDTPILISFRGGTSNDFNIYSATADGVQGATSYYNSTGTWPGGALPGNQTRICLRDGVMFVYFTGFEIAYYTYPDGSSGDRANGTTLVTNSTLGGTPTGFTWDGGSYVYVVFGTTTMKKVNYPAGTIAQTYTLSADVDDIQLDEATNTLYCVHWANKLYEFDPSGSGTLTTVISTGFSANKSQLNHWGVRDGLAVAYGNYDDSGETNPEYIRWWALTGTGAPSDANLSDVITDLCERSGLSASEIDVSGISDTLAGFVHTKRGPAAGDLEQLARSYHFDAVDSGYKIKFVSRGGSSAVTLTEDDLAAHEYGQERPDELIQVRERDVQIPLKVEVAFIDEDRDFDPGVQYAERLVPQADGIVRQELAVLMNTQEAARIAEVQLYLAWLQRHTFEFQLPAKYAYLEPSDVVTLNLDVGTFTVRLVETSYGAPGLVKCKAVKELPGIYTSTAAGESGVAFSGTLKYIVDTDLHMLDMPILREDDNDAGFYYAAGPELGSTFDGAVLYQSNDDGESYFNIDTILAESIIGVTTDVLADGEWYVFDRVNTVNVQLTNQANTLSSTSELNVLNGSNLCVIGQPGRWEVLHFANATLQADNTYTLDTLLRGKRGTESYMNSHQVGDIFIMLSTTTTQRYNPGSDFIGNTRLYKAVTFTKTLGSATAQSFQNNAVGLKPYAPVHIAGTRDGSGNLTITWNRRTRYGGEWRDLVDATLGEDSESYEVDIIDQGSPTTVLRTISVSAETASYTAAQQTTDFGSTQSAITINVYQLSATVGRGYAGSATV